MSKKIQTLSCAGLLENSSRSNVFFNLRLTISGKLRTVVIVPTGLYNIYRLTPLYNQGNYNATMELQQAGLL